MPTDRIMRRDKRPILIILHQERSSPGRVGQFLIEKGYDLDIRRPVLGDKLPSTLDDHAGAVVFGGPMSANDPDEFVKVEIDWLEIPLKENRPYLGICLGAQMLARQLGSKVAANCDGSTEIGWYPLHTTERGRLLMHWPKMVYHFHREGFELPHGAELLASGDAYQSGLPLQWQRLGPAVPRGADAGDDASLGRARRPPLHPAECTAGARTS